MTKWLEEKLELLVYVVIWVGMQVSDVFRDEGD